MAEQHEKELEQHAQEDDHPPEHTTSSPPIDLEKRPSRPRPSAKHQETMQVGRERIFYRSPREVVRSRGIADSARPVPSTSEAIQRQEKRSREHQPSLPKEPAVSIGVLEDRALVKWAAWAALLISIVALVLVGLYSSRDFGPEFQLRDFEITQQKLVTDVDILKYDTQLEKMKIAVLNAYFHLFARKDHATAELILTSTREELSQLIDALPVEKSMEPKQILNALDTVLREVRKGPSSIDEKLKSILLEIEKLSTTQ